MSSRGRRHPRTINPVLTTYALALMLMVGIGYELYTILTTYATLPTH